MVAKRDNSVNTAVLLTLEEFSKFYGKHRVRTNTIIRYRLEQALEDGILDTIVPSRIRIVPKSTIRLFLALDRPTHDILKEYATKKKSSLSSLIRGILKYYGEI